MYRNFYNSSALRSATGGFLRGGSSSSTAVPFSNALRAFSTGPHKRDFNAISGNAARKSTVNKPHLDHFFKPSKQQSPVRAPERPRAKERRLILNEPRVHNFSAGPAAGSETVMRQVQQEWMNYDNTGMGFVEISHRDVDGPVQNCMVDTQRLYREMLKIPDNYHILFTHGGAHLQFSAVPLNLSRPRGAAGSNEELSHAQYVDTGYWADRSAAVAHAWMKTHLEAPPQDMNDLYCSTERGYLRPVSEWRVNGNADYVYFCANETIAGLEYKWDPDLSEIGMGHVPLVCDATSTFMSRPMDISKYGMIFASSGKNLGPAGVTTVIIRDDLVGRGDQQLLDAMPMLDLAQQVNSKPIQNVYNTPPTFNIYMLNKYLQEYQSLGGVEYMEEKAELLSSQCYGYLDSNNNAFYQPDVALDGLDLENHGNPRSRMNVCFRIGGRAEDIGPEARAHNMALEKQFTREAAEKFGIHQLMGHPVFGGLRITLYNPMERESVETALAFMEYFAAQEGYECAGSAPQEGPQE